MAKTSLTLVWTKSLLYFFLFMYLIHPLSLWWLGLLIPSLHSHLTSLDSPPTSCSPHPFDNPSVFLSSMRACSCNPKKVHFLWKREEGSMFYVQNSFSLARDESNLCWILGGKKKENKGLFHPSPMSPWAQFARANFLSVRGCVIIWDLGQILDQLSVIRYSTVLCS